MDASEHATGMKKQLLGFTRSPISLAVFWNILLK
jgi:hypothetical protein